MENDTDFLLVAMRSREVAIYFYLQDIQGNGGEGPGLGAETLSPVYDQIKLAQIRNKRGLKRS